MLLGTRLWYGFFGTIVTNDDKFNAKIEDMCREIGKPTLTLKAVASSVMALSPTPKAETSFRALSAAERAHRSRKPAGSSNEPEGSPGPPRLAQGSQH